MTALIIISLALIASLAQSCDLRCQFNEWKSVHHKVYTISEEEHRFSVFKENLDEIARLNAEMPSAHFAPNKFTDMTPEEFSSAYLRFDESSARAAAAHPPPPARKSERATLPDSYISPYLTPVKAQYSCGACWAFATTGIVEAAYKRVTGATVSLSEQQLIDCDTSSLGCNGGSLAGPLGYLTAFTKNGGGSMRNSLYPYTARTGTTCKAVAGSSGEVPVNSYFTIALREGVGAGVDSTLYEYGPLSVAIDASTMQSYSSGVLMDSGSCHTKINHAVVLSGWGSYGGQAYWVIRNSWGSDWGVAPDGSQDGARGYFWLQRGVSGGACKMSVYGATGVIVSSAASSDTTTVGCVPLSHDAACGLHECGSASDQCGGTILCGTCNTSCSCSADGACLPVKKWVQVTPSGHFSDFNVSEGSNGTTVISTLSSSSDVKRLLWTTSVNWFSRSWTSFMAGISATSAGVIGLGVYGDGKDGIAWVIDVPDSRSSKVVSQLSCCISLGGRRLCHDIGLLSFSMNTVQNFTLNVGLTSDQITMRPYLDGLSLTGNVIYTVSTEYFPVVGQAFVVASGGGKTFRDPHLLTQSSVVVRLSSCHTEDDWSSQVQKLLALPADVEPPATGADSAGICDVEGQFSEFRVALVDSVSSQLLGTTSPVQNVVYSPVLASHLANVLQSGNLENLGYSVLDTGVEYLTLDDAVQQISLEVPKPVLPFAAVIGIAVGGGCTLLVVVGLVTFGVFVSTRPKPPAAMPETYRPRNPLRGVVYRLESARKQHVSPEVAAAAAASQFQESRS